MSDQLGLLPEDSGNVTFIPYVAKVEESRFSIDPKYNQGKSLLLKWTVMPAPGQKVKKEHVLSFTVGEDFESLDGGRTAQHRANPNRRPSRRSRMGMIMHRAFWTPADAAKLPAPAYWLDSDRMEDKPPTTMEDGWGLSKHWYENGYSVLDAKAWEGLVFSFAREAIDYGDLGIRTATMPILHHGTENIVPEDWPWRAELNELMADEPHAVAETGNEHLKAALTRNALRLSDEGVSTEEIVEKAHRKLDGEGVPSDDPLRSWVDSELPGIVEPF